MDLWNNAEISEYLISAAIELEKERLNQINDNFSLQVWAVQSIGLLHACLHNSGMAGYKEALKENPVFKNMPDRVRNLLGMKEEKAELTDLEYYLLTATRSERKRYLESKK